MNPDAAEMPAEPELDPMMGAIVKAADTATKILEVVVGHRAQAIAGGYPDEIANHMGVQLWSLLMTQAFRVGQ